MLTELCAVAHDAHRSVRNWALLPPLSACQRCQRLSVGARRFHIGHYRSDKCGSALSLQFTNFFSPSHPKPCPRFLPILPPLLPTFTRSSMPLWTRMRRRQKASFSHIPLPPSYSPATHPPQFYLFCKTSSSNLIATAGMMRD